MARRCASIGICSSIPTARGRSVDVALKFDENSLSLVTQQQGDFLAQLDANGGDVRKLMTSVKAQTAKMRAAIRN